MSTSKLSLYLFAGNAIFTIAIWLILCLVSIILGKITALSPGVVLLFLNTLVFSIAALSIAFLCGKFIKSEVSQSALANVISLGISFLSGIFVPQYLLGDTVLKISSFTPGYWYVKTIDSIGKLSAYNLENLKPIFGYMLIQLGFAAAFIIVALVVTKQKKQTLESSIQ